MPEREKSNGEKMIPSPGELLRTRNDEQVTRVVHALFAHVKARAHTRSRFFYLSSSFFSNSGARTRACAVALWSELTSLRACVDAKSACFACKLDLEVHRRVRGTGIRGPGHERVGTEDDGDLKEGRKIKKGRVKKEGGMRG